MKSIKEKVEEKYPMITGEIQTYNEKMCCKEGGLSNMNYDELTQQVKALENEQKEIERSIEAKIRRRDKKILDLKLQYIE